MNGGPVTVLLAGDPGTSDMLQKWLAPRGCDCRSAESFAEACRVLSQTDFDIVLCQYDLPDRTALPLLDWLEGTQSTLLFYASSGKASRWLPVIDRGKRSLDRPSLPAPDLPDTLARIVKRARQVPSRLSAKSDTAANVPGSPQSDLVSSGIK
jgi:DNA-binding NtrC family response regulator